MLTWFLSLLAGGVFALPIFRLFFSRTQKYVENGAGKVRQPFTVDAYPSVVGELRASFNDGVTRPLEWRMQQLLALRKMLENHFPEMVEAMYKDYKRGEGECFVDNRIILSELKVIINSLASWMKPEKAATPVWLQPASSYVQREPYGVSLIIVPFNYPFTLSIMPLAAAIAAGNCAVVKLSEFTPHQSALLARLIPQYVDNQCVATVQGAVEEAKALLDLKWDKIFFTGSVAVGRLIEKQVAGTLTPLTLELGGKSPVVVDRTANLAVAARRIIHGRCINAGQTCIAPDYVLVEQEVEQQLLQQLKKAIVEFYGTDPSGSSDYCRLISPHHFRRVLGLMGGGGAGEPTVYHGGESEAADNYIAPTILTNVSPDAAVMQEEIFGPLLPVLPVASVQQAIDFINARPKPLALYVFTEKNATADHVISTTSAGGSCVNETVFHCLNPHLPFGGVGESGMGAYHGKYGFDAFSHRRAIMKRWTFGDLMLRYPPFTPLAKKVFGLAI